MSWQIVFTREAQKDAKKLASQGVKDKVIGLLNSLKKSVFSERCPAEKLMGDLTGAYSRRITIQHRLVYQVLKKEKIIKVIRLLACYE